MRIPARLDLGPYTLHLDVLAARLIRHRRRIRRWSIGFFTLVSTLVLATLAWTLLPWFHGTGTVILNLNATPSPDAASGLVNDDPNDPVVVTINGQPVATGIDRITLRSGQYTLTAQRANRFPITLTFTVTQAQTTTLTLPPLRPIPIVQPVSLPSPDATWHAMAQDVSGGWRVQAQLPTPRTATTGQPGWGPSTSMAEPSLRTILHLDRNGLTRLSLFDAYPVADEIIIPGSGDALGRNSGNGGSSGNGGNHSHRFWATWEPSPSLFTQGSTGALFIDTPMTSNGTVNEIANGTANGTQVISTTQPVRGLWWAPQGRALLVAQSHEQGQRLWLFIPHHGRSSPGAEPERQAAVLPPAPGSAAPAPIPNPIPVPIPIAGNVQSVHWHPDGQAVVVVISADDPPSAPLPPATLPTPTPTPTPPTHTPLHLERDPPLTFPTRSAILIRFIQDDADERGAQVAVTRLQAPPNLASGAVLLAWAASSASASPEHSQEQAWELWWGADTGLGLALDRITLRDGSSVRMGSLPRAIVALTVRPDTSVRLLLIQPEGSLAVVRWPSLEPIFTLPTIQVPPGGALRPGGLWAGDDLLVATSATTLWHVQVEPEALQP